MRAVIQRVTQAGVTIDGQEKAAIGEGLLVLLGIEDADGAEDIAWLSAKIVNLRVFNDENGVMNRSVLETGETSSSFPSSPSTPPRRRATAPATSAPASRISPSRCTKA